MLKSAPFGRLFTMPETAADPLQLKKTAAAAAVANNSLPHAQRY